MKRRGGRADAKDPKDGKEASNKSGKEGKDSKQQEKALDAVALEEEAQNEGFGEWLRSSSGVELMRLFVIANSLVLFMTMAWPNMQEALFILKDLIMGVFIIGVISWYSSSVWKMIDVYFKNRFQSYLRAEYDKNPHMLADMEAYRATAGKESSTIPTIASDKRLNDFIQTCAADVCPVNNEADLEAKQSLPVGRDAASDDPSNGIRSQTIEKINQPSPIADKNESAVAPEAPEASKPPIESSKNDSVRKENPRTKKTVRKTVAADKVDRKKTTKNRLKTITLTDKDFASTRIRVTPQDFAEFDADEDSGEDLEERLSGVLVSELPYKPKADIGDLRKVSAEEYCPLTLEEEMSCDETRTWP